MNKILLSSILAIVAVLSVVMVEVAPMAFADKNGQKILDFVIIFNLVATVELSSRLL